VITAAVSFELSDDIRIKTDGDGLLYGPVELADFGSWRTAKSMAERVGFEPTIPVKVCPLSRRPVIRM
jgi:hypothetical protein